jgi:hypothetical protein
MLGKKIKFPNKYKVADSSPSKLEIVFILIHHKIPWKNQYVLSLPLLPSFPVQEISPPPSWKRPFPVIWAE